VLVEPNPNNKTIKTAKLTFFFIAILWLLLEDSAHHSEVDGVASCCVTLRIPMVFNLRYHDSQDDAAAG
jgi:hypothetical protein